MSAAAITPELVAQHQLTAPEYQKIVSILGREPTYTELGIFSVMWSEHCSYKSSRLHLKKLPTRGKVVLQGPGENAGIIDIGQGYAIAFKIESHNHPSFIEPFQGAATGVGGILRDIFTMGARPIAVMDSLRFGPPSVSAVDSFALTAPSVSAGDSRVTTAPSVTAGDSRVTTAPSVSAGDSRVTTAPSVSVGDSRVTTAPSVSAGDSRVTTAPSVSEGDSRVTITPSVSAGAARNRRILQGVVGGISHYGNCFGVPTVGGECIFEDCYSSNPLVNVFALGVFRRDEIFYAKAAGVGNPVIYVGAKTGRDGIHGASMASAEFSEESKQKRPNVQMGDPFLEKLLLEACLEAMQTGAIVGIQDMGAAGLTCSTCEMGGRGGVGIEIDLKHVPQRETGMTPYEIMLSESQERMLLVAQKGREGEVFDVFRKWGLDAVTIGSVTSDGLLRVKDHGRVVAEIPNQKLADEAPLYDRPHSKPLRRAPMEAPPFESADLNADLAKILASPDICSKQWIWRQYDYMVRTNTLAGPGGDAAIVRIKETGSSIAMSLDGNGRYCYLSPREGVMLNVAECCRNLSTVGALPLAATNNLNFGNPERPEIMAQLVEAIEGMAEACRFFDTPITGGNVSLYNETLGEGIFPTPVMGVVGLLKTAAPVTIDFKQAGRAIVLLGGVGSSDEIRFGGTQYAKQVLNKLWGLPPALDLEYEKRVQAAAREVAQSGLAESAHDLSDGGLAVALAESSFGPTGVGAEIDLDSDLRPELLLFHEGPSRVLISTAEPERIIEIAARHAVEAIRIGSTVKDRIIITNKRRPLIQGDIGKFKHGWETALETYVS